MPHIHVKQHFKFTADDGTVRSFVPGVHEVEQHVADHWYVKAHLNDQSNEKGKGGHGTPAYGEQLRKRHADLKTKLDEIEQEMAQHEVDTGQHHAAVGLTLNAQADRQPNSAVRRPESSDISKLPPMATVGVGTHDRGERDPSTGAAFTEDGVDETPAEDGEERGEDGAQGDDPDAEAARIEQARLEAEGSRKQPVKPAPAAKPVPRHRATT